MSSKGADVMAVSTEIVVTNMDPYNAFQYDAHLNVKCLIFKAMSGYIKALCGLESSHIIRYPS